MRTGADGGMIFHRRRGFGMVAPLYALVVKLNGLKIGEREKENCGIGRMYLSVSGKEDCRDNPSH